MIHVEKPIEPLRDGVLPDLKPNGAASEKRLIIALVALFG